MTHMKGQVNESCPLGSQQMTRKPNDPTATAASPLSSIGFVGQVAALAFIAAANATAEVSEPPRPSVVTRPSGPMPWKPATTATWPIGRTPTPSPRPNSWWRISLPTSRACAAAGSDWE